jgi:hypothetical protein
VTVGRDEGRKHFFFEKKKQKTFAHFDADMAMRLKVTVLREQGWCQRFCLFRSNHTASTLNNSLMWGCRHVSDNPEFCLRTVMIERRTGCHRAAPRPTNYGVIDACRGIPPILVSRHSTCGKHLVRRGTG